LKAVQIRAHGGIDRLSYVELDEPQLRCAGEVIVRLKAAAVNRVDGAIRSGRYSGGVCLPRIPGADGAGTVVAVGSAVSGLKLGEPVCLYPIFGCGDCGFCAAKHESLCPQRRFLGEREDGTYAELVRVPADSCFAVPAGLSFEEAAAFPLTYLTAWRMLFTQAGVKPGESVLIVGAGGGIATAALQIAAAARARIIVASANERKLLAAREWGAEHTVDLPGSGLATAVRRLTGKRGVDIVVNCVGGATWAESLASLARGGRLVTCGAIADAAPQTDLRRVFWNHLGIFAANAGTREEFLQVLNFFAGANRKPILDKVFSLGDAPRAHQRLEERKQFGKIVLRIDS
jgi:NADPH:quinone reductase-like Zn-dependent oxidoreductase